MLQIKRMPVGQIGTNCYLLEDTDAKLCAVIDPGDQPLTGRSARRASPSP